MQSDKFLFKVKNNKDKKVLEDILSSCFSEFDFYWENDILYFSILANDAIYFEIKDNVISQFEENGLLLSCVMVPYFDECFNCMLVNFDNKVHFAYELLINDKEKIKKIKRNFKSTDLETIEAFLKCNGNLCKSAEKLYLHRNSMNYRINQFISNSGINIRNIYNMMFLSLLIE